MAFFKKPSSQEQMKSTERELKKTQHGLERDRRHMDLEEKRIEAEIKKAAREGNKDSCTALAKQLVRLRQQKARSYTLGSKVTAISSHQKVMQSNEKFAGVMKSTTEAMQQMNKINSPQATMKTARQFQEATMKMEMSEEAMNEALDDIFNESDDEEEQDKVVSQVLDEIGIGINAQIVKAPTVAPNQDERTSDNDKDIANRLAGLAAP